MRFTYQVDVEVERVSGKFVGRDEIGDLISEALSDAASSVDVSGVGADGDSEYEVTDSSVDELDAPHGRSRSSSTTAQSKSSKVPECEGCDVVLTTEPPYFEHGPGCRLAVTA